MLRLPFLASSFASLAKELARKGSLSIGRVEELLSLLGFRLTVGFKDAA